MTEQAVPAPPDPPGTTPRPPLLAEDVHASPPNTAQPADPMVPVQTAEIITQPAVERVSLAENLNVQMWKCRKGHVSAAIGMFFSAHMLGSNAPSDGPLQTDKRYCYVCLIEALDKLDVSEVERA